MTYQGFKNLTPFEGGMFLVPDPEGAMTLVLVAKATFRIQPGRAPRSAHDAPGLALADEQEPICTAPVYAGEPGKSSLRRESEIVIGKPFADVVLLGHAHPERARDTSVDVSLRVGPLRKTARAFGPRHWRRGIGAPSMSAPGPMDRLPLSFERAFGGWDTRDEDPSKHRAEPRNPIGAGFVHVDPAAGPAAFAGVDGIALPSLEDPANPIRDVVDRPAPWAFGFVSPDWSPRRELAGTFDEAWRASRFPLAPADFQAQHHNAAPADQQLREIPEGAPVEIQNASASGPIAFELPRIALDAVALVDRARRSAPMTMDTLVIDTDAMRVFAVMRAALRVHGQIHDLEWAKIEPRKARGARR